MTESLRQKIERLKQEKEIILCPHCGEEQDDTDGQYPVNYLTQDAIAWECDGCEKIFWVEEVVTRTYAVKKMDEEPCS